MPDVVTPPRSSGPSRARRPFRVPRSVLLMSAAWIAISVIPLLLSGDQLPFDRPSQAGRSVLAQVLDGWLNLASVLVLGLVAYLLTRRRPVPDLVARTADRRGTAVEVAGVMAWIAVVTAAGWLLGNALGDHPFGLHLPGSIFGISNPPSAGWIAAWATFNFLAYAVVPYLAFRARGYGDEQLGLRSTDRRADLVLILAILAVESFFELTTLGRALFALPVDQVVLAVPLSFAVNLFGTVLPIAILLYGILLPRFLRLTGSVPATIVLGGLSYALVHVFDGWALYTDARTGVLTLCFVVLQYFGPGLIKSILTLRTGNVWVHALGYHAVAPHAHVDAPAVAHLLHR